MIELTESIQFVIKHPIKDLVLRINIPTETAMDDWLPYLNKFEDYLIQEAINAKKK